MAEVACDDRPLVFADLVSWFEAGAKPKADWRVGAEHEKFVFRLGSHAPVPYEPQGIKALLEGLGRYGWAPVYEGDNVIALERGAASVSLEPGGQFELSGAPLETIHDICEETGGHLQEVKVVADELGLGFLGLGYTPIWTREQVPVMPKGRYKIMRGYMPKVGGQGLDMMFRTCTVQANLDFGSEADMVAKFRTSLALQPIATALFANSPFREGRPTGLVSTRAVVWTDTDPDRTGMLDFVFADGFGFETYANYALDVPMYFVKRGDDYIDVSGKSFRDFFAGRLDVLPGERPTTSDWANHLSTIFPEVRLKRYIEMRGADGVPWRRLPSLTAFWVGLLYDDDVLAACWDMVKEWSAEERQRLRTDVPRLGFKAEIRGRNVLTLVQECLRLAAGGLARRKELDRNGRDETRYLRPLEESVAAGITPAEELLAKFHGKWNGSVEPIFEEYAY